MRTLTVGPWRGRLGTIAALSTITLAGCADGPRATQTTTVTDSAGVRITLSRDTVVVFATLDSVPRLSIGGADASGPTQFFRVQNIHVDPSGRLWVADGQSAELRIFRPDGRHWKTVGGRGEGPGEFLQIRLLGAGPGDSVLVGDGATDRLTVFDPEGEFVRSQLIASGDRPTPRLFDVFADGSLLGQVPRIVSAATLMLGQILADSVELVRVDAEAPALEPYAAASGPLWLWTGRNQVPIPFTINASFVAVDTTVHLVSGSDFRIRVFDRGRLLESYGVERASRMVRARDVQAYRTFVDEYVQGARRAEYLAALDHERRPELLPAYDRVLAASDGHIWAHVYDADLSAATHRWDVFERTRRFLGEVRVPGSFYPMAISGDALAGVWRDSLGVEHVRVYAMRRAR